MTDTYRPNSLTPIELQTELMLCMAAQQPACVWSDPGCGKSDIVETLKVRLAWHKEDLRLSQISDVDARGLPAVEDNGHGLRSRWCLPDYLARINDAKTSSILFLDELNRGLPSTMNAMLQLVRDRRIGPHVLRSDCVILAACNYTSSIGTNPLSDALNSRFVHYDLRPDLDSWCKWAITANVHPLIIALLRYRPELLHQFHKRERSYPCPRTWDFVSRILNQSSNLDVKLATLEGAVGHGAAIECAAFISMYKSLPSIDAILLNPTQAPIPANCMQSWAITSALSRRVKASNIDRVLAYMDRVPEIEYSAFLLTQMVARDPQLAVTPEYTRWCIAHDGLI